MPAFFSDGTWRDYVDEGGSVLAVPRHRGSPTRACLEWQAAARWGFPVVAGYFVGPDSSPERVGQYGATPTALTQWMAAIAESGPRDRPTQGGRAVPRGPAAGRVDAVVLPEARPEAPVLLASLTAAFGEPEHTGGVHVWDVRGRDRWRWLRPRPGHPPQRPTPSPRPDGTRSAPARSNHPIRTVLVVYLVSRVVALLALWVAATWFQNPAGVGHADPGIGDLFGLWDGVWYERIVRDGYPVPLPVDADTGAVTYSAWAFYPLYPYLVKAVMLTGLPFTAAGVLLNVVLGGLAAVLIWAVLRTGVHADRQPQRERLALVAACLWCFYPTTAVMLKPYTEALAVALVAGALLLIVRRRYLLVAAVALPSASPRRGARRSAARPSSTSWCGGARTGPPASAPSTASAPARSSCSAPSGVSAVAWPVVAGLVTGVPTAFFDVQAAWGQRPDKGPFVLWIEWAWEGRGVAGVVVLVAPRRHLRRARPRPARPLDLDRGPGVGAGLPALPLRRRPPDHEHVALPAARLPHRRARRVGRDAHRQRAVRRAALAAPRRRRARSSSSRARVVDVRAARLHPVGLFSTLIDE